jgi:ATP-dependent exoDNAse (exonuclease V) beta subunit
MNSALNFEELRKAPHWSFSSLNQILNLCSLQYAFRKVDQVQPDFVPVNLVFGKSFHKSVSHLYRGLREKTAPDVPALQEHFTATLKEQVKAEPLPVHFGEEKDLDWHLDKGRQMLQTLVASLDPKDEVIGVDVPFIAEILDEDGRVVSKPLIGEFDAVVENQGRLVVVDFKTAAAKWPAQKCHSDLQATAYLMGLRQSVSSQQSLFRYDVVTKTKEPAVTRYLTDRTDSDFLRFTRLVQQADRIIEQALYYPHEGCMACAGCPYTGACAKWHQGLTTSSHQHLQLSA